MYRIFHSQRDIMTKRMTIEFTEVTWNALQELKTIAHNVDEIETLRRALGVYDLIHRLMNKGATIKAHYPDGREHIIEI